MYMIKALMQRRDGKTEEVFLMNEDQPMDFDSFELAREVSLELLAGEGMLGRDLRETYTPHTLARAVKIFQLVQV